MGIQAFGRIEASIDPYFNTPEKRAESQRRSRLIGAGPDLLAACKQLLEAWGQWDDRTICLPVYESITRIRAAVAKAEGED